VSPPFENSWLRPCEYQYSDNFRETYVLYHRRRRRRLLLAKSRNLSYAKVNNLKVGSGLVLLALPNISYIFAMESLLA